MKPVNKQRQYNRADRMDMVVHALSALAQDGKKPEATAYKLARALDMAVSPHLYSILSDMVAQGRLNVRDEVITNRCERTFYQLPRSVKIRKMIILNGQLIEGYEGVWERFNE
jgi:hypothetical protein